MPNGENIEKPEEAPISAPVQAALQQEIFDTIKQDYDSSALLREIKIDFGFKTPGEQEAYHKEFAIQQLKYSPPLDLQKNLLREVGLQINPEKLLKARVGPVFDNFLLQIEGTVDKEGAPHLRASAELDFDVVKVRGGIDPFRKYADAQLITQQEIFGQNFTGTVEASYKQQNFKVNGMVNMEVAGEMQVGVGAGYIEEKGEEVSLSFSEKYLSGTAKYHPRTGEIIGSINFVYQK